MDGTDRPSESGVDIEDAVRELDDRIPLVKAHLIGRDAGRVAESNAMPWTDVDQREQVFAGMGVVAPPYEPETLAILFENSNSLRQNVDSYLTNIDAFGHRLEPIIDLDAEDADQRIAQAIYVERLYRKDSPTAAGGGDGQSPPAEPTPEEVAAKKREVTQLMRLEKWRIESFFDFCCVDMSFVTLRRQTRQDLEVMGNGYWEVLRNGVGEVVQFVYIPGFTVRLLPLDAEFSDAPMKVKISPIAYGTVNVRRRFRRYVQVFEQQMVFFKEFGDPRTLSKNHGLFYKSVDELLGQDPEDAPATEIMHFKLHNPRSAYGTPRWIGSLLSVLGSRQAEEVNFLYFENKSVPPLALLVSGGRLSAQSVPRIESFIETHIRGKRNFHKILVLEAEPAGPGGGLEHTGRMKIELRPLTMAQQQDALFQHYNEANVDKVGQSFRLPRLLRGDIRDFNQSTADAALSFAEMQVFQPEREDFDFVVNRKILPELGIRFWRFRSNAPVTRDPAAMADIVRGLVNANVLTPEEGRELASDVFNREFRKVNAMWVKQPVSLTLAGIPPQPEPENPMAGPDVAENKDDLSTADLDASGGRLMPAQGLPGRRRRRRGGLAEEAQRLIALRNAFRDAEERDAEQRFHAAKRDDIEREIVTVPAEEFRTWFRGDSDAR